jgi:hypothetical protein
MKECKDKRKTINKRIILIPNRWTVLDKLVLTSAERDQINRFWNRGIFLSDAIQAVIDMRH